MLEPTDEMVHLIYERIDFVNHGDDGIREGLADVFAIVERENQVHPLCAATLGTDMRCDYVATHPGEHSARGPHGARIRWS